MMNGNEAVGLDNRIKAQSERLQEKATTPAPTAEVAPVAEPKPIAELRVRLFEGNRATVEGPEEKEQYMLLLNCAINGAIDRAAKAGQQVGAEWAVREIAANPKMGPLLWFRQKFGRAPSP